jgi:hypothetical protein
MRLLYEASAPVNAPLPPVQALIDNDWILTPFLGDPTRAAYVDIDHRNGVLGLQGHWWYRGEITATQVQAQTLVTYRVYNIAGRSAWAVPLANRLFIGYAKTVHTATTNLAAAIETHLTP